MRTKIKALSLVAALAATGVIVMASPASAASTACLAIGGTSDSYLTIVGHGSIPPSCPGSSATLTIQRSRWYGWQDMANQVVSGPGTDQYIYYNCAGTGTHDFRTIIWAHNGAGDYVQKASNTITTTC